MARLIRLFGFCVSIITSVLPFTFSAPISASCGNAAPAQGPIVRDPVAPQSSDTSVQEWRPAPQWQAGDPVQVRPDLKSSSSPRVSDPVTPKVKEESLEETPTITPPPPDAPVRVMPDLRETPPSSREPKQ